jgi:para-aminobenzoate synthetase / 4-amino-4-deoxychorismate lyase
MPTLLKPDPDQGVFETMLVCRGRVVELDAHLGRLSASLGSLFSAPTPASTAQLVLDRARNIALGRLRLTVAPSDNRGLRAWVAGAEVKPKLIFPAPQPPVQLHSFVLPGGHGSHKWVDRRQLKSAEAATQDGSIPLLTDQNGDLLESSRANVFVVWNGVLLTPESDGRILPGIARQCVIEVAREANVEVREGPISHDLLRQVEEVFLSGSLRGVEPASQLDGGMLGMRAEISALIAAGLRRRWLSETEPELAPMPAVAPPRGRPAP